MSRARPARFSGDRRKTEFVSVEQFEREMRPMVYTIVAIEIIALIYWIWSGGPASLFGG